MAVKDPLRQLIDLTVYAPIGLVLLARKELPNLVAAGKSRVEHQVTLARFMGKLAVKRGGNELKRRFDAAEAARNQSSQIVDARIVDARVVDAESVEVPVWTDDASTFADVADVAGDKPPARGKTARTATRSDPAPQPVAALPIDGYDSLAASQVVVRLGTLTADELDQIRRHEESHRARRTIIGKISQLQAR